MKAMSLLRLLTAVALGFMAGGCEHKDLCYDHSHMTEINIAFDWADAPDAAPISMVAHFFTMDGEYYRRVEFALSLIHI